MAPKVQLSRLQARSRDPADDSADDLPGVPVSPFYAAPTSSQTPAHVDPVPLPGGLSTTPPGNAESLGSGVAPQRTSVHDAAFGPGHTCEGTSSDEEEETVLRPPRGYPQEVAPTSAEDAVSAPLLPRQESHALSQGGATGSGGYDERSDRSDDSEVGGDGHGRGGQHIPSALRLHPLRMLPQSWWRTQVRRAFFPEVHREALQLRDDLTLDEVEEAAAPPRFGDWFETLMLAVLTVNLAVLALFDPYAERGSAWYTFDLVAQFVLASLFGIELTLRAVGLGFRWLLTPLRLLDSVLVLLCVGSATATAAGASNRLFVASVLRTPRLARAFRRFGALPAVSVLVEALRKCAFRIADVSLLVFSFVLIFAVACIGLFGGRLSSRCIPHQFENDTALQELYSDAFRVIAAENATNHWRRESRNLAGSPSAFALAARTFVAASAPPEDTRNIARVSEGLEQRTVRAEAVSDSDGGSDSDRSDDDKPSDSDDSDDSESSSDVPVPEESTAVTEAREVISFFDQTLGRTGQFTTTNVSVVLPPPSAPTEPTVASAAAVSARCGFSAQDAAAAHVITVEVPVLNAAVKGHHKTAFVCGGDFEIIVLRRKPWLLPGYGCSPSQVCVAEASAFFGARGYDCPVGYSCDADVENPGDYGGRIGFDNVGQAFLTLYIATSLQLWFDVAGFAADGFNFFSFWFITAFVVLCVLLVNLLIVLITVQFDSARREAERNTQLDDDTAGANRFQSVVQLLLQRKRAQEQAWRSMVRSDDAPAAARHARAAAKSTVLAIGSLRRIVADRCADRTWFYGASTATTFVHIAVLASQSRTSSDLHMDILRWVSVVALVLYSAELAVRFAARPIKVFAMDTLHWLDIVVVATGWCGVAFGLSALRLFATLRLGRALEAARWSPGVYKWLLFLAAALRSSPVVLVLLFANVLLFALFGMHVLGGKMCNLEQSSISDEAYEVTSIQALPLCSSATSVNTSECSTQEQPRFSVTTKGGMVLGDLTSERSMGHLSGGAAGKRPAMNLLTEDEMGSADTAVPRGTASSRLRSSPALSLQSQGQPVVETSSANAKCPGRPRYNFDTFVQALITSFQIITGDNWNDVMYAAMAAEGDWMAIPFVLYFYIGNLVLLSVFVGILLSAHSDTQKQKNAEESKGQSFVDATIAALAASADGQTFDQDTTPPSSAHHHGDSEGDDDIPDPQHLHAVNTNNNEKAETGDDDEAQQSDLNTSMESSTVSAVNGGLPTILPDPALRSPGGRSLSRGPPNVSFIGELPMDQPLPPASGAVIPPAALVPRTAAQPAADQNIEKEKTRPDSLPEDSKETNNMSLGETNGPAAPPAASQESEEDEASRKERERERERDRADEQRRRALESDRRRSRSLAPDSAQGFFGRLVAHDDMSDESTGSSGSDDGDEHHHHHHHHHHGHGHPALARDSAGTESNGAASATSSAASAGVNAGATGSPRHAPSPLHTGPFAGAVLPSTTSSTSNPNAVSPSTTPQRGKVAQMDVEDEGRSWPEGGGQGPPPLYDDGSISGQASPVAPFGHGEGVGEGRRGRRRRSAGGGLLSGLGPAPRTCGGKLLWSAAVARRCLRYAVGHFVYKLLKLLTVLASGVAFALRSPVRAPDETLNFVGEVMEATTVWVFVLDVVVNIAAHGVFCLGGDSSQSSSPLMASSPSPRQAAAPRSETPGGNATDASADNDSLGSSPPASPERSALATASTSVTVPDSNAADPSSQPLEAADRQATDDSFSPLTTWIKSSAVVQVATSSSTTYFARNKWNVFDFVLTVCGVVLFIIYTTAPGSWRVHPLFQAARAAQALRPMTVIRYAPTLDVVAKALGRALVEMRYAFAASVCVFIAFAVIGIELFSGASLRCLDAWSKQPLVGVNETVCLGLGGAHVAYWGASGPSFDDFLESMFALFVVMTLELWSLVMYQVMDHDGLGLPPRENANPWAALYFVTFAVVGGFVLVNVFTAVLVDCYNRAKRSVAAQATAEWAREHNGWIATNARLLRMLPKTALEAIMTTQERKGNAELADLRARKKARRRARAAERVRARSVMLVAGNDGGGDSGTSVENDSLTFDTDSPFGPRAATRPASGVAAVAIPALDGADGDDVRASIVDGGIASPRDGGAQDGLEAPLLEGASDRDGTEDGRTTTLSGEAAQMAQGLQDIVKSGLNRGVDGSAAAVDGCRARVRDLILSRPFVLAVYAVIALGFIVMAVDFYPAVSTYHQALEIVQEVITGLFAVEALLKMIGLTVRAYLSSRWNRFDLFVVCISIASFAAQQVVDPRIAALARALRVFRLAKLLGGHSSLGNLAQQFFRALAALVGVVCLVALFFFTFAVLAVNLFGRVVWVESNLPSQSGISHNQNFASVGAAMFSLLRVTLGGDWWLLWWGMRDKAPYCDMDIGNCGPADPLPALFFVVFIIFSSLILKNLLVAVMIDEFSSAGSIRALSKADAMAFLDVWASFDPELTMAVRGFDVLPAIRAIPASAPLGFMRFPKARRVGAELRFLTSLKIKDPHGLVDFGSIADALCDAAYDCEPPVDRAFRLHYDPATTAAAQEQAMESATLILFNAAVLRYIRRKREARGVAERGAHFIDDAVAAPVALPHDLPEFAPDTDDELDAEEDDYKAFWNTARRKQEQHSTPAARQAPSQGQGQHHEGKEAEAVEGQESSPSGPRGPGSPKLKRVVSGSYALQRWSPTSTLRRAGSYRPPPVPGGPSPGTAAGPAVGSSEALQTSMARPAVVSPTSATVGHVRSPTEARADGGAMEVQRSSSFNRLGRKRAGSFARAVAAQESKESVSSGSPPNSRQHSGVMTSSSHETSGTPMLRQRSSDTFAGSFSRGGRGNARTPWSPDRTPPPQIAGATSPADVASPTAAAAFGAGEYGEYVYPDLDDDTAAPGTFTQLKRKLSGGVGPRNPTTRPQRSGTLDSTDGSGRYQSVPTPRQRSSSGRGRDHDSSSGDEDRPFFERLAERVDRAVLSSFAGPRQDRDTDVRSPAVMDRRVSVSPPPEVSARHSARMREL